MVDKLQEAFDTWKTTVNEPTTSYQAFQGGYTAGSVSMRARALAALDKVKIANAAMNALKTAIGELPDIG